MAKVEPHPDGGFLYRFGDRRIKPPPATPWARFTAEVRKAVEHDQLWIGRLSEFLPVATGGTPAWASSTAAVTSMTASSPGPRAEGRRRVRGWECKGVSLFCHEQA